MVSKTTMTEKELETKIRKWVEARGGMAIKLLPSLRGLPDRLILMPGGMTYFIEVKSPKGGKLSELQKHRAKELNALGFKSMVINNLDEFEVFKQMVESGRGSPYDF